MSKDRSSTATTGAPRRLPGNSFHRAFAVIIVLLRDGAAGRDRRRPGDIAARIDAAGPAVRSPYVTQGAGLEHAVLEAQSRWLRQALSKTAP